MTLKLIKIDIVQIYQNNKRNILSRVNKTMWTMEIHKKNKHSSEGIDGNQQREKPTTLNINKF